MRRSPSRPARVKRAKGRRPGGSTISIRPRASSVRIASDYARLPPVEVPLTRAMDRTLNASGTTPFFLDRSKTPMRLDISFINEVSWAGVKR
jgi:hypothetical protein